MSPQRAAVKTVRNASTTEYTITGALNDVFAQIETLFYEWPGDGYGTAVKSLSKKPAAPEYVARMSRANSCS